MSHADGPMRPRANRYLCERRELPATSRRTNVHAGLVARSRELSHIDQLLWQARRSKSGVVALHGECGVGKSALIEAAVARATEFRTVQVRGRGGGEPGALPAHWPQPLSDVASRLGPTAEVRPRFALPEHAPYVEPDTPAPALVDAAALAFHRMLDAAAGPLLVTVDDCQMLPAGLVQAMAEAVLSHMGAAPISLVLAWRDTPHLEPFRLGTVDVPEHRLGGLSVTQAHELLASRFDSLPSNHVLAALVARSGGNPLALVDVCSRLTPAQLGGWHPLPDPLPVSSVSAEGFDVIRYMPPPTRRALAVVAAGGASRQVMVDAMRRLGVDPGDLRPALEAGIIYERGPRIDFRHQLVRSVAFHRAPLEVRQAVRGALSDVLAESQAIEASAYHASVDVVAPDEMAARRLVEAARVALDRGDPASAARNEELAARCAPAADAAGRHLADAANHWQAAGERERAQYCVDSGAELDVSDPVAAELSYQRARLAGDRDEGAADQMVEAAEACLADRPHRALAMLVDAAAWQVLANRPGDAEAIADRAVRAAGSVSSHSEVLARTVRAAATLARGGVIDEIAERSHVSLLIGQTERFPSSPEVALVIGLSLGQQGLRRQAERWAEWIGRCAEQCGDRALAVVPPLLAGSYLLTDGRLAQAEEAVLAGTAAAEDAGSLTMVAWGWHLAVLVHTLAGRYERGFAASAQLFALADRIGGLARLRTLPVLALLELARGHTAAAAAWARTAEEEILLHAAGGVRTSVEAVVVDVAPVVSTVFLLARRPADAATWVALIEADGSGQPVPAACRSWLRGACAGDARAAVEELAEVSHAYRDEPFRRALVDLCWAARLVDAGMVAESALRLDDLEQRMRAVGAEGLVALVDRERTRLPAPRPGAAAPAPAPAPLLRPVPAEPHSGWEISLLGGFAIRNKGQLVTLPASLAAQAVKIVALHPRITVDELIECLWEDAEPGVGQRRLRNVLWRIRSACGDLLVRDGNFVRLAPEAVTDLARFRSSADDALVGPNAGTTAGVDSARQALECYRGELLPGDRYADWAAATRESVARTYLRLLDVLVEDALAGDRQGEALVLLERLAEVDPFDERHHLRVAEIHLEAGNRGRALDALERAESMLADLRVAPSPEVRRLREALDRP